MKLIKGSVVLTITITLSSAILLLLLFPQNQKPSSSSMSRARSFVLWLHGLGDSGPANEPIKTLFTSSQFRDTKWSFPSAPSAPVTCNCMSLHSISLYFQLNYLQFACSLSFYIPVRRSAMLRTKLTF